MRTRAATLIRQIRADVRAGACQAARRKFDTLVPLVGSRGAVHLKKLTVVRLWSTVNACRWKGKR